MNQKAPLCKLRGEVFYDAECAFCLRGAERWSGLFERRGFRWMPLQTPGVAVRLGVSETALLQEMTLQLADGRIVGGVDSWIVLFRSVWWLWPMGLLMSLPACNGLSAWAYRRVAANRRCFSGHCKIKPHSRHHAASALFELP